jgi:hypothetical protein
MTVRPDEKEMHELRQESEEAVEETEQARMDPTTVSEMDRASVPSLDVKWKRSMQMMVARLS